MNPGILKRLYRDMLKIRMVEEKVADLYPDQEMRCPVHLCIGQEAVASGICANLTNDDYCLSSHRSHGHYLAKGGNLKALMAELYGKATGCSRGIGGSMHIIDLSVGFLGATSIVASTIPIAVGAAFGTMMKNEDRVTVAFFGDGATEEGVFHESVSFAVLKKLPIVFVCENNLFSVYSPLAVRQPEKLKIFEFVKGYGIESYQADGNNVLEVYNVANKAIDRVRHGVGPVFLEFLTYRWREHCGPNYDNDLDYRPEGEFLEWRSRCPIEQLSPRLLDENILTDHTIRTMEMEIAQEIEEAVSFAKTSPYPDKDLLLANIYAPDGNQGVKL